MLIAEQYKAYHFDASELVDYRLRPSEVYKHVKANDQAWLLEGILLTFSFGDDRPSNPRQEVIDRINKLLTL